MFQFWLGLSLGVMLGMVTEKFFNWADKKLKEKRDEVQD